MSTTHNGMEPPAGLPLFLLAIRGTLAPPTLDAARALHNTTAGAPANVAAAQALGDLSHMVYVPLQPAGDGAGEFLILDVWNSIAGLNQFFANAQVQEQAGQIFASRDPVVWAPAAGLTSYHLPVPSDRGERIVALVRGRVHSQAAAAATHNTIIAEHVRAARRLGAVSHEAYFRLAAPDSPDALEFFAVDVWSSAAGMAQQYANPVLMRSFQELFTAPPATSAWTHPVGPWVEW